MYEDSVQHDGDVESLHAYQLSSAGVCNALVEADAHRDSSERTWQVVMQWGV
jgi:hypothetical protein